MEKKFDEELARDFLRGDRVCKFKPGLPAKAAIPVLRFGCRSGPNVRLGDQKVGRKSKQTARDALLAPATFA